jgi:hypothetical protein
MSMGGRRAEDDFHIIAAMVIVVAVLTRAAFLQVPPAGIAHG